MNSHRARIPNPVGCFYVILDDINSPLLFFFFILFFNSFDVGKSLVQSLLDLASCGTVVAGIKFTVSVDVELKSLLAIV